MDKTPAASTTSSATGSAKKTVSSGTAVSKDEDKDTELDHADSLEGSADSLEEVDKECQDTKPDINACKDTKLEVKPSVKQDSKPPPVAKKSHPKTKVTTTVSSPTKSPERSPPLVAPKPKPRNRSMSSSALASESSSSSSGEELSKSQGYPVAQDGDKQTKEQRARKKSLPAIPVPVNQVAKKEHEDANGNKENNNKYSPTTERRGSVDCGKARVNKIKNKKERAAVMKRASSMTDLAVKLGKILLDFM